MGGVPVGGLKEKVTWDTFAQSHSPVLSSVPLGSIETVQVLIFGFKLAGGGSHMGSLQGAELQQGLKPANLLELSLREQRG